jgi:hypothetical protein
MKTFALAASIVLALTATSYAASTKYYVVMDTVHNCSVVESKPSSSLKVLKGGLPSEDAAKQALAKMGKKCKGVVE